MQKQKPVAAAAAVDVVKDAIIVAAGEADSSNELVSVPEARRSDETRLLI